MSSTRKIGFNCHTSLAKMCTASSKAKANAAASSGADGQIQERGVGKDQKRKKTLQHYR